MNLKSEKYTQSLTKGVISEQILTFAAPFIIGNICMQLYNYVDAIIVGQFLGKQALAAVGASSPFIFVLTSFITGITIGGSIIISKYFAKNDLEKINISASTISIITFIIGLIVTGLGFLFYKSILKNLNLPDDVLPLAVDYLYIYIIGMMPIFGYNTLTSLLRGVGNSRTPLYFLIGTSILNVILDIIFVVVCGWGVESVAWATVISQFIAYLSLQIFVNLKIKQLSIFQLKFSSKIAVETIKLGIPTSIQQLLVSSGTLALSYLVNMFGTDVIAAFASTQKVLILIMVIPINLSLAITTFTAQNYAVNNYKRIFEVLKITIKASMVVCFAVLVIFSMFSTNIIQMFTNDINIINIGKQYLLIISMSFWLFSLMMVFTGIIRGLGNTVIPMLIAFLSLWGVKLPTAYFLSIHYHEVGIWFSEPISWIVGFILSILFYFRLKRRYLK